MKKTLKDTLKIDETEDFRQTLDSLAPDQIADLLYGASSGEISKVFNALDDDKALRVFDNLTPRFQNIVLHSISTVKAAFLLKGLQPDDRTQFLQELPKRVTDELIRLLPYEERILTRKLLGYPEGSIGRLMTPDYISVKKEWSINDVFDYIREHGRKSETIDDIYVVDERGKLLGYIKLKEFLYAPKNSKVQDLLNGDRLALEVNNRDEKAIEIFEETDRIALPVVDNKGTLLGIVTIDDILRLSSEEATEDIQKIGGSEALDEPYMQTPFFQLMKKRAGWLIILFLGELLTATALSYFEYEIAKAVVLALFLPLIISSGGNAGSQASTLIIRAMALGEIKLKDWWKIVRREVAAGLFLGTILGLVGFLRINLWSYLFNMYGEHSILIGLTIFFALIGVVLWGTLSGALFPLLLRALKIDPATSSAPFVATVVDVVGLIIYFHIATWILKGTLL